MALTIPYVKQTWTDGVSQASAARMGVLEDGVFDVSYAPAVSAFHNASQSLTSAVDTALALNSERFDQAANASDTMHDLVTNNSRLTCRYAGVYQITGLVEYAANSTGMRRTTIRLNGATLLARNSVSAVPSGSGSTVTVVTRIYSLAVNDYVELMAYQDSGGALNAVSTANYSPEFMMVRVG